MKRAFILIFFSIIMSVQAQEMPAPSYNSMGLKVHFDDTFNNPDLRTNISSFIKQKQIGWIEKDKSKSHISLSYNDENYTITQLPDNRITYKIDNSKPSKTIDLLEDKIYQYAYGFQIKNLNLKNEAYKFSFRLLPVVYNTNEELETISVDNHPKTNGILNFNTIDSAAILEVTNLSDNPIYFSVIEINSRGELSGFIPNVNCALIGSERKIPPHKTVIFSSCYFQFAPPFETLTLKGFASPIPLNLNPMIGIETLKSRGSDDNASLEYIKDFYTEMFTYEFEYNIVDEKGELPYNTTIDKYELSYSPELQSALLDLSTIKEYFGIFSLQYNNKLIEISEIHKSLGNIEEAKEYDLIFESAQRGKSLANLNSARYLFDWYNDENIEGEELPEHFDKMSDSLKILFLLEEYKKKNNHIAVLNRQIEALNEQLNGLNTFRYDNQLTRGTKPKERKKDIVSEFTYRALIIAEENYTDDNISDLKFPIDDATELNDVLINNYAFEASNITFLKDATRRDIFDALDILFKKSSEKDHLLIFYAGHGVYDEDFKRGYWLPSDAVLDSKSSWMSNLDIKDYISNIKTKHTLLISDACFSGSIFEFNRDVNTETSTRAVEKLLKKNARNAMTSGLDKPVPDESVFIKYLLKTLKENQSVHLKASDLFKTIQEVVLNNTENIPQYGVIRNTNHEGGEFIFLKRE
ncbi:caspase family protein [Winogradskyella ouciana]|uniref:Peptidase C14 caspase domain-containing protein n=1 Tax=Winogradskyella ouciana TaxID=2608631 RepID=A0A7K1GGM2_9FLAO|nr:caspase family protein [Winogradskyella ouciana]MTE28251.1 hypothetical protein [Winogradskyella ouciana]